MSYKEEMHLVRRYARYDVSLWILVTFFVGYLDNFIWGDEIIAQLGIQRSILTTYFFISCQTFDKTTSISF